MPWIGDEGKRRINIRVDAINLFNIPNFYFNSRGNTPFGFGTYPAELPGTECIANVSIVAPTTANCPAAHAPRSLPRWNMMHGCRLTISRCQAQRLVRRSSDR